MQSESWLVIAAFMHKVSHNAESRKSHLKKDRQLERCSQERHCVACTQLSVLLIKKHDFCFFHTKLLVYNPCNAEKGALQSDCLAVKMLLFVRASSPIPL